MDNLTDIKTIKEILSKHGFTFSKALGQNFLIDPSVCPRIAEYGGAKSGSGIIEIGAGIGVLTNELAKRADKVVSIEIDTRLIPILEETLAEHKNTAVINGDVMKLDLAKLIEENFEGLKVSVCANLPYYITSPIIMRLLESRLPLESITVMVQKEAGVRLCAEMGTRDVGAVTAAVRYYSEPERLFDVPRGSFIPAPNVDSCVIRLRLHDKYKAEDEEFFFKTVRGAFLQRRKNLLNSLSSSLGIGKSLAARAADAAGISQNARPEQLSMEDFLLLAKKLKEEISDN